MQIKLEFNDQVKIFLTTAFDIQDLLDKPGYLNSNIEKVIQKPIILHQLRAIIDQSMQIMYKKN